MIVTYEEYQKQIEILRQLAKDLSIEGEHAYLHQLDLVRLLKSKLIANNV